MKLSCISNNIPNTTSKKLKSNNKKQSDTFQSLKQSTFQEHPKETVAVGIGAALLLMVGIYKRKSITKFFKSMFNSKNEQKSINDKNLKIELPKPNFTEGEKDIQKIEKEKADYINSIRKEFINIYPRENKEKCLLGLDALLKYGTHEDLLSLDKYFYDVSKDNDIIQAYAKLVGKVGHTVDRDALTAKVNEEKLEIYNEKTYEEIFKALKTIMVDKSQGYDFTHFNYRTYKDIEFVAKHFENNPTIKNSAIAIMKKVEEFNPSYNRY